MDVSQGAGRVIEENGDWLTGNWRKLVAGRVYASTLNHALHASIMGYEPRTGSNANANDPITLCPPNLISWIVR